MKHKVKVLALIADGVTPDSSGDIIHRDGVCWKGFQIPVTNDFHGRHLGVAEPKWEGDKLYANITLFGETLEKYKINPAAIQFLTPAIGGKVLDRKDKQVLKCQIDQIALTCGPNADPRIKSIKEQKES